MRNIPTRIFCADLLHGMSGQLVDILQTIHHITSFGDIQGILILLDGTFLPVLE